MISTVLPRPTARLALLTIVCSCLASQAIAAEPLDTFSSMKMNRSSNMLQVDSQMLPGLLPPMSSLAQSPYTEVRSISNPLSLPQNIARDEVIRTAPQTSIKSVGASIHGFSALNDQPMASSSIASVRQNLAISAVPAPQQPLPAVREPVHSYGLGDSVVFTGR